MGLHYQRYSAQSLGVLTLREGDASAPRLLCFPYAGGSARAFSNLAQALPKGWTILAVDLPGRLSSGGMAVTRVEDAAARCLQSLPASFFEGYLLGHSYGGYVAMEIARQMSQQRSSHQPRGLMIAATTPPLSRRESDLHESRLDVRSATAQPWVAAEARVQTSEAADALAADLRAFAAYHRSPPPFSFRHPVLLCAGKQDSWCRAATFVRWTALLPQARLRYVEGDHFFVQSAASHFGTEIETFIAET